MLMKANYSTASNLFFSLHGTRCHNRLIIMVSIILQPKTQACPISSSYPNSAKYDDIIIIIINGWADLFARYGVFSAEYVVGWFICLSLQLVVPSYPFPLFCLLLIYYIISGHCIFFKKPMIYFLAKLLSFYLYFRSNSKIQIHLTRNVCLFIYQKDPSSNISKNLWYLLVKKKKILHILLLDCTLLFLIYMNVEKKERSCVLLILQ